MIERINSYKIVLVKLDELIVLFFGKMGVGKSSILNILFGLNWVIDYVVVCIKEF